jgi:hypothetical protein
MRKYIFIFSALMIFFSNTSFIKLIVNPTFFGWLMNGTYIVGLIFLLPDSYNRASMQERMYIFIMILGLMFHSLLPEIEKILVDSIKWIFLIVVLMSSRKYNLNRYLFYTLMSFFIIHCILGIVENNLGKHLFDYSYVDTFQNFSDKSEFRAFGLMEHPLISSNVSLIIMSFILVSKDINWKLKFILLTLGTMAVISFNSRTALVIWSSLLIYRIFFYNVKPIYIISFGTIIYGFFINDVMSFILSNSQIFGRLSVEGNITDESSLTRILSYVYFWNAGWNFQDIVFGGRILYLPGTDYSLENGILLNISWWGWIVGIIKVILELFISYMCLYKFSLKEKVILMIACWGTAFSNNNSFQTFVFAFFIISLISINSLDRIRELNNTINTEK